MIPPLTAWFFLQDRNSLKLPLTMLAVPGPAMLFNELFERLKQPGMPGQIQAGVLGWVSPNQFVSALGERPPRNGFPRSGWRENISSSMEI